MTFIGAQFNWWFETLFTRDWTLDREVWPFATRYNPDFSSAGLLVESWEFTGPTTITLHIREGIHWQDKEPVNGREFTAYDVEHHYARQLGNGYGYTEPSVMNSRFMGDYAGATATDRYTVDIEFKAASASNFHSIAYEISCNQIEAPESVEVEGGLTDWEMAVGTGPWLLTYYRDGVSRIYSKNPDYWGFDERHPENQVPYVDTLKVLLVPEESTRIAALRTGQIDLLENITLSKAQAIQKTNPELIVAGRAGAANCVELRCDTEPFTDIKVRTALQMAIDLPTICETYYSGSVEPIPVGLVNPANNVFCYLYDEWSQELKDEYAFNPTRAKELLAEAGYPDGFDTNCVASVTQDTNLLQIVKAYFLDIGVDMEIRTMESAARQSFVSSGKHDQMVQEAAAQTSSPYPNNLKIRGPSPASNYTYHNDATFFAMIDKCAVAATFDELVEYVREADKYAIEQHWSVITSPPIPTYTFSQPYFIGFTGGEFFLGYVSGPEFARCWIDQEIKESMGR